MILHAQTNRRPCIHKKKKNKQPPGPIGFNFGAFVYLYLLHFRSLKASYSLHSTLMDLIRFEMSRGSKISHRCVVMYLPCFSLSRSASVFLVDCFLFGFYISSLGAWIWQSIVALIDLTRTFLVVSDQRRSWVDRSDRRDFYGSLQCHV